MADKMKAAVAKIIAQQHINLKDSSYILPSGSPDELALLNVATKLSAILSQPPSDLPEASSWGYGSPRWPIAILAALKNLQQHPDISKSSIPDNEELVLMCRVERGLGKSDKVETKSITVQANQKGSAVMDAIGLGIGVVDVERLLVLAHGKKLHVHETLSNQGWRTKGSKPMKILVIVRPPIESNTNNTASHGVSIILDAATRLTRDGFGEFELSDARTGRLVPIPVEVRAALIAAIVLHSKGKELLTSQEPFQNTKASALNVLPYFVEADSAYDRCRIGGASELLNKLDNYGILQLDLCWIYALLGDADFLPDAARRLAIAERVIASKLDPKAVEAAEAVAQSGGIIPGEFVQIARFWLLRGLESLAHDPKSAVARADLTRSALFIKQLKVDQDSVAVLMDMGATLTQATSSLRASRGSVEAAVTQFLDAQDQRRAAAKQRAAQKLLGTTKNGTFVELSSVESLVAMGFDKKLVVAALKRNNNDMQKSLSNLTTLPAHEIIGGIGRTYGNLPPAPVDEMALATMLSMGFDRSISEKALQKCGDNLESAIIEATKPEFVTECAKGSSAAADCEEVQENADMNAMDIASADVMDANSDRKAADQVAYEEARAVIEQELGESLSRNDIDDEVTGVQLNQEELLLKSYGFIE